MLSWFMRRVQTWPTRIGAGIVSLVLAWAATSVLPGVPIAGAQPTVGAQPTTETPPIAVTTLAVRHLDEAPPGRRWVLRRSHPINENAHAHAGGFIYAAVGATYLVVEDSQGFLMQEGQAAWAPEGIGHLHTTASRATNAARAADDAGKEIWTILLEREIEARQPGAAAVSPPLVGLTAGPYEARLVAMTFLPGATTGLRSRTGPELVYPLDGQWELEYLGVLFPLDGGQGYLADPGVPHRLRNTGDGPARLLSAQLVPEGGPAEQAVSQAR
jgi:quercetin dioxygenase-like cupin family protein